MVCRRLSFPSNVAPPSTRLLRLSFGLTNAIYLLSQVFAVLPCWRQVIPVQYAPWAHAKHGHLWRRFVSERSNDEKDKFWIEMLSWEPRAFL